MSSEKESKAIFCGKVVFLSLVISVMLLLLIILLFGITDISYWLQDYGGLIGSIFAVIVAAFTIKKQSENVGRQITADRLKSKNERLLERIYRAKLLASIIRHRLVGISTTRLTGVELANFIEQSHFDTMINLEEISSVSRYYSFCGTESNVHANMCMGLYALRKAIVFDDISIFLDFIRDIPLIFKAIGVDASFVEEVIDRGEKGDNPRDLYNLLKNEAMSANSRLIDTIEAFEREKEI